MIKQYWKQAAIAVLGLKVIALTIMVLSLQAKINRNENAVLKQNKALRETLQAQVDSLYQITDKRLENANKLIMAADSLHNAELSKYRKQLNYLNWKYESEINRIDSLNDDQLRHLLSELSR